MAFTPSKNTKAIDKAVRDAEVEMMLARKAYDDPYAFCKFTLRSQRTRERIQLLDGHYRMIDWLLKTERGVVKASPQLGKTTVVSYGLMLWLIGRDWKRYSVLFGSALKDNAEDHLRTIRDSIHNSRELRMVFPCFAKPLIEDNNECVRLDREEFSYIRSPTIQIVGNDPKKQGLHQNLHIYDDALVPEIARSPRLCEQQAELVMMYDSRVIKAGDPHRWFIQNCFYRWDTGQILVDKYGWDLFLMPAIDEAGKTLYSFVYPQAVVDNYPPSQKDADLRCIPRKEGDSVFTEEGIEKVRILGMGTSLLPSIDYESLPDGAFVVHGVDPAGGRAPGTPSTSKGGDDAAIMTTLFAPVPMWLGDKMPQELTLPLPSEESRQWLRALPNDALLGRVLWITSGKFGLPEMIDHILDLHERYGPAPFIVETNGVQVWLAQALALVNSEILVRPFRTGANKHHEAFGVNALANEYAMGIWALPTWRDQHGKMRSERTVEAFIEQIRGYVAGEHTPDSAIAQWLCRHGARMYGPTFHGVGEIGMGSANANYYAMPTNRAFGMIPALADMLGFRAEKVGIPLLPEKNESKNVDEATRKRFGL